MIKFEIERIEEAEEIIWLVRYDEYVVSIRESDINFDKLYTDYIHIENIDYIYDVLGEEETEERVYYAFEIIEKEVIKEIGRRLRRF